MVTFQACLYSQNRAFILVGFMKNSSNNFVGIEFLDCLKVMSYCYYFFLILKVLISFVRASIIFELGKKVEAWSRVIHVLVLYFVLAPLLIVY